MRMRDRGEGRNPERALSSQEVAFVSRFAAMVKGAVAVAWYAAVIVAPFWLLKIMLSDLLPH
jgi:hypothetical protein